LSAYDVVSFIGTQRNWIIPESVVELDLTDVDYASGTEGTSIGTVTLTTPHPQRIYDPKSGLQICILDVPKDARSIDQTEGILSKFERKLTEEKIEPVDLVKRAWKSSEHNVK